MDLRDINFKVGSVNPSGIKDVVYFIPIQDIATWPTIEDDFDIAQDPAAYAQYKGSFVLQQGKKWIQLYNTQGKGSISWTYEGETDCKVVVNQASLSYPKLTEESRAFAKYAANGDFVFIMKHDGKYYVIGNKDYRATLTPNGTSGDAAGSQKGITIEIQCPDTTPLPTYVGTLELSNGTLDCSDDSFTRSNNNQQDDGEGEGEGE